MKRFAPLAPLLIAYSALALAVPAQGQDDPGWAVFGGVFDLADNAIPEAAVEYRWRSLAAGKTKFVPAAGVAGTSDGGFWAYGSLRLDWEISDDWIVTPFTGVSLFEEGDGKDLGGAVEFRSGFEISYRFAGGSRLGIYFYHLSNARIYEDNPGSNSLGLVWGF